MRTLFRKIFHLPVYVHLLAVGIASVLCVYLVLRYLDIYTTHNQAVFVPDVRGLQVEDAATFLEQNMLRYTVIDSIYSKEVMPGAIVELMPEANAKVKKNRTIYITINAKTEETVSIPDVTDTSYRQAYAQLRSLGFDVERKYVPGDFLDLTVGVEYKGNLVSGGMRVPRSANLILLVSDGNIVMPDDVPAIDENIEGDESWF